MRVIVVFFIGVGCFFYSGCTPTSMHGLAHPYSDIEAPTFCLYKGWATKQDAKPHAIDSILIYRAGKINDERFDWKTEIPYSDQDTWEMAYDPDGKSKPAEKPFSCLTYGQVPPGYIETIPAQPLISERVYTVRLRRKEGGPMSWVYFIIRADAQGHPIQLEYSNSPSNLDRIHVITKQ